LGNGRAARGEGLGTYVDVGARERGSCRTWCCEIDGRREAADNDLDSAA
jgi:hypothetical protein